MTTLPELTERDREIGRLESEIIEAWVAADGKLPHDTFVVLMSSAKNACDPFQPRSDDAADRALDRLRSAAEATRS